MKELNVGDKVRMTKEFQESNDGRSDKKLHTITRTNEGSYKNPTMVELDGKFWIWKNNVENTPWRLTMSKKGKESAYPVAGNIIKSLGLTKREYIATEAMKGLLGSLRGVPPRQMYGHITKTSLNLADEILKQLEEQ